MYTYKKFKNWNGDLSVPRLFQRRRAATTQSQGDTSIVREKLLPTVFKWEGGGKEVFITGSFNQWRTKIPMAKR